MKILTFAGSLRKDSLNKKISHAAMKVIQTNKLGEVDFLDLQALQIPIYDGDLEAASGLPAGVKELCAHINRVDAIIISTPEYNGSIPGVLKNVIDWVSRQTPNPFLKKHILLCSASPGALGGIRGLWHTRVPFEAMGSFVYPDMVGFPKAHEALDTDLKIADEKMRVHFERVLKEFIQHAQ